MRHNLNYAVFSWVILSIIFILLGFIKGVTLLSCSKEKLNIKGQKINIYALTVIKRLDVLVHHGLPKCEDEQPHGYHMDLVLRRTI